MSATRFPAAVAAALVAVVVGAWFLLRDDGAPPPSAPPEREGVPGAAAPGEAPARPASSPAKSVVARTTEFRDRLKQGELVIFGVVYDEAGERVGGAKVELFVDVSPSISASTLGEMRLSAVTTPEGDFWFEDPAALRLDERYVLRVAHPDFATERLWPIEAQDPKSLRRDVVLRRTAIGVSGRVVDERGAPLAGATAAVLDLGAPTAGGGGAVEKSALTDAEGAFSLAALKAGVKTVRVSLKGYTTAEQPNVNLVEGTKARFDFKLAEGRSISGRVYDARTGRGVPGARVDARFARLHSGPRNLSSDEAAKRAAEIETIETQNRLDAAERATKREARGEEDAPPPEERPSPEVEIEARRAQAAAERRSPPAVATTDAEGRFVLDGLEDGTYELAVAAKGYRAPPTAAVAAGATPDVGLEPNGALVGRVVDAITGEPVEAFSVALTAGPEQRLVPWSMKRRFSLPAAKGGAFEYVDVAPGRWQLVAEAPGYAGGRSEPVTIAQGERREGLEIRMVRGFVVSGRVVGATGAPVKDVDLVLDAADLNANPLVAVLSRGMRRDLLRATTDREGRYVFPHVMEGSYVLQASHPSYAPKSSEPFAVGAEASPERPDLTLVKGASITGRVLRRSDGAPDVDALVRVTSFGAAAAGRGVLAVEAATDAEGRFECGGLPAGTYRVLVVRRESAANLEDVFRAAAEQAAGGGAAGGKSTLKEHVVAEAQTVDVGDL